MPNWSHKTSDDFFLGHTQMASTIFYSWQSDLPNATNRGFIQTALERAARSIRDDMSIHVEPVVDRDTTGVPGSPDIATTILQKIDSCDVFVCDVSIINSGQGQRPAPNPNVLFELGYALKRFGWGRVLMILNAAFGPVSELPFDLRMKRVLVYSMQEEAEGRATERRALEARITTALQEIFRQDSHVNDEEAAEHSFQPTLEDFAWRDKLRNDAVIGCSQAGFSAFVEAFATLSQPRVSRPQTQLLQAAYESMIHTFGWPIGVMDLAAAHMRPTPIRDGITNTIIREGESYDFWALRQDGSFYLLKTFFEDTRRENQLVLNTRIVRTAEMLLYLSRLYRKLEVPNSATVSFTLRHVGLNGSSLSPSLRRPGGPAKENEIESTIITGLSKLDEALTQHVMELLSPLFILFDFLQVDQMTYERIVDAFRKGRVT
jgi:hypothetical protein